MSLRIERWLNVHLQLLGKRYFFACYKDFLKGKVKEKRFEKIKLMLMSNCFYSGRIDSGTEDAINSCVNTNFY